MFLTKINLLLVVASILVITGAIILGSIPPCDEVAYVGSGKTRSDVATTYILGASWGFVPPTVTSPPQTTTTNTTQPSANAMSDLEKSVCRRNNILRIVGLGMVVTGSVAILGIKTSCMC